MKIVIEKPERRSRADAWNTPEYQRAVKRLSGMNTHDILEFLDQSGTSFAAFVSSYRTEGNPDYLLELKPHVSVMQAAVEELIIKSQSE